VPAPEIENLVLDGVRKHLASIGEVEHPTTIVDRDLIERYVDSVIVKPQALDVCLVLASEAPAQTAEPSINDIGTGISFARAGNPFVGRGNFLD
jgi:hypothetical protein